MRGNFSISHYLGDPDDTVEIEVVDESSNIHFFELKTNKRDLMDAIMGHSGIDCEFTLRGIQNVGMVRERKQVIVPLDVSYWDLRKKTEDELHAYLAPFEVDGWTGSTYDMRNTNNGVRNENAIRVSFTRFVDRREDAE